MDLKLENDDEKEDQEEGGRRRKGEGGRGECLLA